MEEGTDMKECAGFVDFCFVEQLKDTFERHACDGRGPSDRLSWYSCEV